MPLESSLFCLLAFLVCLVLITKPLGLWLEPLALGDAPRGLARADYWLLRGLGIYPREQNWLEYAACLVVFNLLGAVVLYAILRLQAYLPFNPQHVPGLEPGLAFNTTLSYVANTNWQSFAGEVSLSYFSQMAGLAVQNFVSTASAIGVAFVLMRSFVRHQTCEIGNFWVDLTRIVVWVLLPVCVLYALFLLSQGVIQNFEPYQTVSTLAGGHQTIAMGPVASQEAIKLFGTNGGGFFNVNSAHPFENPGLLTNFLGALVIMALPSAMPYVFGRMLGDTRQGWTLWGAMTVLFVLAYLAFAFAAQGVNPLLAAQGSAGGPMDMEGKDVRFDLPATALYIVTMVAGGAGAANASPDSLLPLAGLVPAWLLSFDEVVFGAAGSGFYGMMIFAVIAVFVAGLMVGRTPEYQGKKILLGQMKLACFSMLVAPILVLLGTAITCIYGPATQDLVNNGPHAFTEIFYAWSSAANNNGSAFGGVNADTWFFNISLGVVMWIGRFAGMFAALALAGSLVEQRSVPDAEGTLKTYGFLFMCLPVAVVMVLGSLIYLPALTLGPLAELGLMQGVP